MGLQEFSDTFDTLLNSYSVPAELGEQASRATIVLDEYEKSLFLTKAQKELVVNFYNGKNPYRDSFESTEELRRYLDSLVKTKSYSIGERVTGVGVSDKSVFYRLPPDIAFITLEQIKLADESLGCYNGNRADVYPITQDEYNRVKDNPFRGPTKYKALRLDYGNSIVELISKYSFSTYLIKYLSNPSPIILEDLPNDLSIEGISSKTECKLNPILHDAILERAVRMALIAKGVAIKE